MVLGQVEFAGTVIVMGEAGRMTEYLKTSFSDIDDGGVVPAKSECVEILGMLIINADNGGFLASGNSFRIVNAIRAEALLMVQQGQFPKEDPLGMVAEQAAKQCR